MAAKSVKGNRHKLRILEPADVVLDVGVGPHLAIQFGGVAFVVGVVASEPVFEIGQEALLGTGMQRLAPDARPGSVGPAGQVDQIGDITTMATSSPPGLGAAGGPVEYFV